MGTIKRSFTLENALDLHGEEIPGIPSVDEHFFGSYYAPTPKTAASKAYSSVLRFMKKYPQHYPLYSPKQSVVVSIVETTPSKNYGKRYTYVGTRQRAPQSLNAPRVVISPTVRQRVYNWTNTMIPL